MLYLQVRSYEDIPNTKLYLYMSLFQSKCRYRVVEQYILGSYESNYNIVEEFNYSFSKSDPNLPPIFLNNISLSRHILSFLIASVLPFCNVCFLFMTTVLVR